MVRIIDGFLKRDFHTGPQAFDEEDGNLTAHILACPPSQCLSFGCPGHELLVKGLAGCGVDTQGTSVGSTFNITFGVFDFHQPRRYTSIVRTVVVAPPCPPGELFCSNIAACSTIPCKLLYPPLFEDQIEPVHPPDIYLDLHNVPERSVELVSPPPGSAAEIGSLIRPQTIRVWGICGWALPVNLTAVCGDRSADSCNEHAALCALRVQRTNKVVVATVASDGDRESHCAVDHLRDEMDTGSSANSTGQLSGRPCMGCSARLAMRGRCEPSTYSMTMRGVDVVTGEQGAAMGVSLVITPAVARARIQAYVGITASSDDDLQVMY